jgi:predicted PurR-regulated permease PerM
VKPQKAIGAMKSESSIRISDTAFIKRLLMAVAVGALLVAMWKLSEVILLAFGSVLVAVILRTASGPLVRYVGIGEKWAIAIAGLLLIAVIGAVVVIFGTDLAQQFRGLAERLPSALKSLSDQLQISSLADVIKGEGAASSIGSLLARVVAWSSTFLNVATGLLLVIFGGIYIALDPKLYRDGFLKLIPRDPGPAVAEALDQAGEALRWISVQVVAMVLVGALTGTGFWLIGLPSPLALGLIAGLAEIVPLVGPVVAAVPALVLAASQDWQTVAWAVAVIFAVQQIESNVIAPLLIGRNVSIAPAVALFAIVSMGVLFGPLGLLFGYPLAIVFDVLVRCLYIHDTLGKPVDMPSTTGDLTEDVASK